LLVSDDPRVARPISQAFRTDAWPIRFFVRGAVHEELKKRKK
jgi:hypothetical protein